MAYFLKNVRIRTYNLPVVPGLLAVSDALSAQDKHIDVSVSGNKPVILNSECSDRPNENGCILAGRGTSPMISWELTGLGSEQWSFSDLPFNLLPLQDCTVADFGLSQSDRQSGVASTAQIVANGKRLQIRDHSQNQSITQYTLSAVSADGMRIDSDPVIDYRGR